MEISLNEFRVTESDVALLMNRGNSRRFGSLFVGCAGFLLMWLLAVSSGVSSANTPLLKSFGGNRGHHSLEVPARDVSDYQLLAALPVETASFAQSARRIVYTNAEEVARSKYLSPIEWRAIHRRSEVFKPAHAVRASGSPTLVTLQKLLLL